jgi:cell wall-associated NlpC family hydrolase
MQQTLIIKFPVASVYINPKANTEVNTQAIYSSCVHLLEARTDGWCKIKMIDQEEGWVKRIHLTQNPKYQRQFHLYPVKNLFAHIYRVAETTPFPPLMTLPFGAKVKLCEMQDLTARWLHVELANSKKAWVQRGDLDLHPLIKQPDQIIPFAMQFIGIPYTWGGSSSFGYDCSGFIQMLFREMGYTIPRNARDQVNWNHFLMVDDKNLQERDILFFGEKKVTHVGLYLGRGQFLHAGVRDAAPIIGISNLAATSYTYITARRLITNEV